MEGVILYIKIVHVFSQEDKKHYIIFTLLSYGESLHHFSYVHTIYVRICMCMYVYVHTPYACIID